MTMQYVRSISLIIGLALTATEAAAAATTAPEGVLAQGPLAIVVHRTALGTETRDPGDLFLLTKTRLIYHASSTGKPVIITAAKKQILKVEARERKLTWEV